jgi:histidinol dehydrogenase
MPLRLDVRAPDFQEQFARLVDDRRESGHDVASTVTGIIAEVRREGDRALQRLTQRFDRVDLDLVGLEIGQDEIDRACAGIAPEARQALELAARRIGEFHALQRPQDRDTRDEHGTTAGVRWGPVDAAGIYVPGGRASYPSSVLMNAIPAKVAGVERLVMATPTPGGQINPLVLAAARIAGVDRIYRVGGAQAVAALALGTNTIAPVDVIVGPGNAYVAEAKRQLYGVVGIDMVAGPSEIVVVADGRNDAAVVAADLLAQAEHDPAAQSILITDDAEFARLVEIEVQRALEVIASAEAASASWDANGAIIIVSRLEESIPLVNRLAPEHLALATDTAAALFAEVRHAGSVFLGRNTPEAVGDYVAGPNHVLPTGRRARFSSGLSVVDFMKRTTWLDCSATGLAAIGPAAVTLAGLEGLPAHARSVALRLATELGQHPTDPIA